MINKIILFGSSGMLGHYIYTYFKNNNFEIIKINYRITKNNYDFEDIDNILINNNIDNNTCIINCIGIIPQRFNYNIYKKDYIIINGLFPNKLANICNKYGAKMIQPSTDCVFNGDNGNYNENDIPNENSIYGLSKYFGEPENCTVIRTSLIGFELKNKKSLIEWLISNNNSIVNGWNNHIWNGITCLEYCKIIHTIINKQLFWNGVKHIYSPSHITKYDLLIKIKDKMKLNIIINKKYDNNNIDKTLNTVYDINRILNISSIDTQLDELINYII